MIYLIEDLTLIPTAGSVSRKELFRLDGFLARLFWASFVVSSVELIIQFWCSV